MPLDSDQIVDRRRMRRKLTFWRVATIAVAVLTVIAVAALSTRSAGLPGIQTGSIARIKISGLIRTDQDRTDALDRLAKSSARAVIVHIDSPGGTTAGAEQLHNALLKLKQSKKPLVVVVDGLAASGGYMAAITGDHIIAQQSSLVGSIGVLFQYPNFTELLKTVGVKVEEIKSSPLKAAPNGFEPTSPEARAAIEAIVMDSYAWFKGMVRDARKLDDAALERVADGRVFTGRQALSLKLVDELGNEQTAIAWLSKERNIDPKTPVRDYSLRPRLRDLSFLHVTAAFVFDSVGLTSLARKIEDTGAMRAIDRLNLDGLLALWHPVAGH
ncbi:MAG: signal peptide peptidase SppA [Pseudorhodoplanes sp.]